MKMNISNEEVQKILDDLAGKNERHPEFLMRDVEIVKINLLLDIKNTLCFPMRTTKTVHTQPTDNKEDIIVGCGEDCKCNDKEPKKVDGCNCPICKREN